jgi:hypothetical protein
MDKGGISVRRAGSEVKSGVSGHARDMKLNYEIQMTMQNNENFFFCIYTITLHFKILSGLYFSFEEEDVLDV